MCAHFLRTLPKLNNPNHVAHRSVPSSQSLAGMLRPCVLMCMLWNEREERDMSKVHLAAERRYRKLTKEYEHIF
jgi:hypothetical protein